MIGRRATASSSAVEIAIAASVRSPDIRALAIAAGWQTGQRINCTIRPGVHVPALTVQNLPHDALTLIINSASVGGIVNGGTGLTVIGQRISVDNRNGLIFGAGGAGGAGGAANATQSGGGSISIGGGGGGYGEGYTASGAISLLAAAPGSAGGYQNYTGVKYPADQAVWVRGGTGGSGGAAGAKGSTGGAGDWGGTGSGFGAGGVGGQAAGLAVSGNSLVNWLALGTIKGSRSG